MTEKLDIRSDQCAMMKEMDNFFSYYTEQIANREGWTNEPDDIDALTAADFLISYCRSRGKHCQGCVFAKIRQELIKNVDS